MIRLACRRHRPPLSRSSIRQLMTVICWWTILVAPAAAQHGIYFDVHRKDLTNPPRHVNHPHVDGVFLRFKWAEIEPQRGRFRFDLVEERIGPWVAAGKKVIIGIMPTAQRDGYTPEWVFRAVKSVNFVRSRKRIPVRQIKCWDPKFLALESGLIAELGQRYDKDKRIEAVMVGVGHLGFLTAAPSREGAEAFLKNGWTPEKWTKYALETGALYKKAFPTKRLYMRGSSLLLRTAKPGRTGLAGHERHYVDVRDAILSRVATEYGMSVGANGLSADPMKFLHSGLPALFAQLADGVKEGRYRLEVSDDWPLWVPREKRHGVNAGKDNAHYKICLENAIGGVRGIPKTNISFMKMLSDDLRCTDPNDPLYQPDCEDKLRWFKSRLRR